MSDDREPPQQMIPRLGTAQQKLTGAISASILELHAPRDEHDRTTATTRIINNIVVCVLEGSFPNDQDGAISSQSRDKVIRGGVNLQADTTDDFSAAIERLTHRQVTACMTAGETAGLVCKVFLLDGAPIAACARSSSPRE